MHGLASPFAENHGSLYNDQHHARWQLRSAFYGVLSGREVPEVAAYNHSVILTGAYVEYSTHVPGASAGFSARFRDTLASYVVYMFERKLNTYFSCQDCLDRYPCHVDCMVDYLNDQYDLLESGSVDSLETYQESMNRSAEDAVRTDTYMSVARAAAAVMSAEEYMDGGTLAAPVRPPIPLNTLLVSLWDQTVSWLGLTALSRVQMRTWAMSLCSVTLTLSTCIQTMLVPLVLSFMAQTRAWRLTSCRSL